MWSFPALQKNLENLFECDTQMCLAVSKMQEMVSDCCSLALQLAKLELQFGVLIPLFQHLGLVYRCPS